MLTHKAPILKFMQVRVIVIAGQYKLKRKIKSEHSDHEKKRAHQSHVDGV